MKKKLLVTACFAAVCAFLGVLIYSRSDSDSKQSINSIDSLQTISYDASTEYEEAIKELESIPWDDYKDSEEEIKEILKPELYTGRASIQVDNYLNNFVNPVLEANKEFLGLSSEINV